MQCDAGADEISDRSYIREARHGCFSQCDAGADVVQAQIEFIVTLGEL